MIEGDFGRLEVLTESGLVLDAVFNVQAVGAVSVNRDITQKKRLEKEREQLITNLKQALEQVKLLSGLVPICSSCKNIRDDAGFWQRVEVYIEAHSEAEFTHGICPDCIQRLYPDYADTVSRNSKDR